MPLRVARSIAIEGELYPVKPRPGRIVALYRYHVEAARLIRPLGARMKKVLGGKNQALAFVRIDALERAAPLPVLAIAYFGEYYCIAIEHDQIEFATAAAPILRQHLQALAAQKIQGMGLRLAARAASTGNGGQRGVSGKRLTWPLLNSAQGSCRSMRWLALTLRLPDSPCRRLSGNALSCPKRGARA